MRRLNQDQWREDLRQFIHVWCEQGEDVVFSGGKEKERALPGKGEGMSE